MNKVMLLGRLTSNSALNLSKNTGRQISRFILKVHRQFICSDSENSKDFSPPMNWEKIATFSQNHLNKKSQKSMRDQIRTHSWIDNKGIINYASEITSIEECLYAFNYERDMCNTYDSNTETHLEEYDDSSQNATSSIHTHYPLHAVEKDLNRKALYWPELIYSGM